MEENNQKEPGAPTESSQSEPRSSAFDLEATVNDAVRVIMDPRAFYREMPTSGGFMKPLVFVVFMAAVMGLFMTIMAVVGFGAQALVPGIGALIFMPIFIGIFSFVGAAVMFVIWKLMGSERGYQTAYRCVAYSTAVLPVVGVANLVPYLGTVVSVAWGMYLMAMASIEVHHRKRETAYAVCAVLGLVLLIMNVANERESRRMRAQIEQFQQSVEGMTPEEAGRAFGEFLQGLEESMDEQSEEEN